jgi:hypothetical protein
VAARWLDAENSLLPGVTSCVKTLYEGHGFCRAENLCSAGPFKSVCENSISKLSPGGTAELSPGR